MSAKLLYISFLLLFLLPDSLNCLAQQKPEAKKETVRLIKWSAADCDHTYDPYRLKARISNKEVDSTTTILTVNFADNCCVAFKPEIKFNNNKLVLLPYKTYSGSHCACDCCFSIRFEIAGLTGRDYKVFFKGKQVTLSEDYYEVVKPSYALYKGEKINSSNKYGFPEGRWITFYNDGTIKNINQYPDYSLYDASFPLWTRSYYPSGKLSSYSRKDTSEYWFEDGTLKSQQIEYTQNDTTYKTGFAKFDNRRLLKEYSEKSYPTVFTSELDPAYKGTGSITETIYKSEYYNNGKPSFLFGRDTSYSWYATGAIASKRYSSGELAFDENGRVKEKVFFWGEKGPSSWGDLKHALYVHFYPDGSIQRIHFVRDESYPDESIAPSVHYDWEWDKDGQLTEAPGNWQEAFPWKKFAEISIPEKHLPE